MRLSPRDALLFSIATLTPEIAHVGVPIRDELLSPTVLRDYQLDMLREASALMRQGFRRVLLQLPTGGGKTVMAGQALLGAQTSGFTGQFLVHRKELIDQTSESFTGMGLRHGFVAAGRPFTPEASVTLAGVLTLANRLDLVLPPDLLIIDECHHAVSDTWSRVLAGCPDAYMLGLTATPERLDGRGLADQFDAMVIGPPVAELIRRKFLSRYDYYAPSRPDTSGLHSQGGDFRRDEAAALMDQPELVGDVVAHYLRLAKGKQGIVFAVNRDHSRSLVAAFQAAGVRAAHVDGALSDTERGRIVRAFRAGELDLMVNCELFGEGFDVPGIVYVGLARPTKSLALFLQQVGRALRVLRGKVRAIICDHAGNAFIHGLPDDPREWSLDGRVARARGAVNADAEPVRQCLTCYRVYPSVVKVCPGCGTQATPTAREIRVREGELEKLERLQTRAAQAAERAARRQAEAEDRMLLAVLRKAEERGCRDYADFHDLAVRRGYDKPGAWARMRVNMRNNYATRFS